MKFLKYFKNEIEKIPDTEKKNLGNEKFLRSKQKVPVIEENKSLIDSKDIPDANRGKCLFWRIDKSGIRRN